MDGGPRPAYPLANPTTQSGRGWRSDRPNRPAGFHPSAVAAPTRATWGMRCKRPGSGQPPSTPRPPPPAGELARRRRPAEALRHPPTPRRPARPGRRRDRRCSSRPAHGPLQPRPEPVRGQPTSHPPGRRQRRRLTRSSDRRSSCHSSRRPLPRRRRCRPSRLRHPRPACPCRNRSHRLFPPMCPLRWR